MKSGTRMQAMSIAFRLLMIVSCPSVGPLYSRLMGSLVSVAGRLPALNTLTWSRTA